MKRVERFQTICKFSNYMQDFTVNCWNIEIEKPNFKIQTEKKFAG